MSYTARGKRWNVLAWGAVNAIAPALGAKQVDFKLDYSGGWGTYKKDVWKTFANTCSPYTGPPLAWRVTSCTAQGRKPLGAAGMAADAAELRPRADAKQAVWELRLSHWTGDLPALDRQPRLGLPEVRPPLRDVRLRRQSRSTASSSTAGGNPLDSFGRNLYVDTFNSAYGSGWKRENSFLTHKASGTFCYGFYPHGARPAGHGERYRATIIGPGVTPDVMWQGKRSEPTMRRSIGSSPTFSASSTRRTISASPSENPREHACSRIGGMIAAIVFDMDGVIVDTEQVWDEVREELVADWGGRYSRDAQQAMMGMSSGEWSRYMHDELGLEQSPREINDEVVRRMLERYRLDIAADRRGCRRRARPVTVVPARGRLIVESPVDRHRPRDGGHRRLLLGNGVVRGGRAGQAEPRRLPRSRATPRRRSAGLCRCRRLAPTESAQRRPRACA